MADENILQRVIKRMADMQAARHIGRRVDDGIRFGILGRSGRNAPVLSQCVYHLVSIAAGSKFLSIVMGAQYRFG